MVVRITDAMLIVAAGSAAPFTATAVSRVRRILAAAGHVDDVELHRIEIEEIRRYRDTARAASVAADRILARGPLPHCCCSVDPETGLVAATNDCQLGHTVGGPPDEPS